MTENRSSEDKQSDSSMIKRNSEDVSSSLEYTFGPTDAKCPDCGTENSFQGQNSHGDVICTECGWYTTTWRFEWKGRSIREGGYCYGCATESGLHYAVVDGKDVLLCRSCDPDTNTEGSEDELWDEDEQSAEQRVSARLDTFGPTPGEPDHDWSAWRTIKDPDSMAVDQRVCLTCGRHQFRDPNKDTEPEGGEE